MTVALGGLVGGLALETAAEQRRSVEEVELRFRERIDLASDYVTAHIDDMRARQVAYAETRLADPVVAAEDFEDAALWFGFEASVLLDDRGRAIALSPADPALTGTEIASRYDHLSAALAGADAVSDVVRSAARGIPIVAVAAPYDTPTGRRVISGGYALGESPLADFLASTSTLRGRYLELLDSEGEVIASTGSARTPRPPADDEFRAVAPVDGTSWRLVATVPLEELVAPVQSSTRGLWHLVAAAAALALAAVVATAWISRQRDGLRRASRTDCLTGLSNRRWAEQVMDEVALASWKRQQPWAVAMIDIDRFKQINDTLGHTEGDEVLRAVMRVIATESRVTDFCARWGGDEFLVTMADTGTGEAIIAGERIASAVRAAFPGQFTVSIGTAAALGGSVEELVKHADDALYEAKAAGRDRVHGWNATPPCLERDDATRALIGAARRSSR